MATPIKDTLATRHIVLDGAMGTQLEEIIPPEHPLSVKGLPLWSTKVLVKEPELITKIHRSYVDAGATMLITSLYQASLQTLRQHQGMGLSLAQYIWQTSIDCAKKAVGESKVWIAGAVGPYGAFLANGAEYSGDYGGKSVPFLADYHRDMVEFFARSDVDCIAFETIPNKLEVQAIIELMGQVFAKCGPKEFYITLSCKNETTLADGTPLDHVLTKFLDLPELVNKYFVGTGCNCVPFESVSGFIETANKIAKEHNATPFTLIVYPNFGFGNDMSDVSQYTFQKKSDQWALAVEKWVQVDNVRMVGACCSTGPEEVADIHRVISQYEN